MLALIRWTCSAIRAELTAAVRGAIVDGFAAAAADLSAGEVVLAVAVVPAEAPAALPNGQPQKGKVSRAR